MKSKLLTASLIAVPALVALKPIADSVYFQPEDGSSASKEYTITASFSLGDFSAMVDGQDMSEMIPAEFDLSAEMAMSVTDQYVSTLDGRMTELIRTFDALSMIWEGPEGSGEDEDMDELEGKSVRFAWNEDDEEYEKSFHECEGDEDALDNLAPEMDLQALLPDGDVSEGDTWSVESSSLGSLVIFGTDTSDLDMSKIGDGDEIEQLMASEINPQLQALMDSFEADCEYMGTREVDGMVLGVIAVRLAGEGDIDLSGLISSLAESQIPPEVEVSLTIDEAVVTVLMEGEGELLWDVGSGLFHTYDMTAEIEIMADVALSAEAQGQGADIEGSAEILGDMTWAARRN